MKRASVLHSTLGLLVIAGLCQPMMAAAAEGQMGTTTSYGEDAFYDNLKTIQSHQAAPVEPGAQGPVRSETMEPLWATGEGGLYDNLNHLQSSLKDSAESGARGPIRSETMTFTWSSAEGGLYDNLRHLQSGQ